MRLLGRELLRRRKGLRILVEKYPVSLAVNLLRRHEFTEGICSVTVDSADQLPFRSAVKGLKFLLTIVDNGSHRGRILSAFFDENYCCHVSIFFHHTEDRVVDFSLTFDDEIELCEEKSP